MPDQYDHRGRPVEQDEPEPIMRYFCLCSATADEPGMVVCWKCEQPIVDLWDMGGMNGVLVQNLLLAGVRATGLLNEWLEQGAAMGGGPRANLTVRTLEHVGRSYESLRAPKDDPEAREAWQRNNGPVHEPSAVWTDD